MKLYYRILSLVLTFAIFASCCVFAAEAEEPTLTESTKAGSDVIVGDWLFTDTIVNRGTNGAAKIMKEYAAAGVTDVYLLCKGISGRLAWASNVTGTVRSSSSRDYLQEACDAAKTYGIRVHAWMMASRDTHYVTNIDSSSPCYHFRVGITSSVNQFINLRDTGYRNYMTALVKELVSKYDIAGIHLDTIRYGALYYDWGLNARTELINNYGITKAEYNAATKAMCVTGGYAYTTNADGYYVYSSSGSAATGTSFASALAGNGSTDANNGAKKFAQFRKDNITNFVKLIKEAAGAGKVISCAIMPETCSSDYESALYGQSPKDLGGVVDYVAVMSYSCEYNAASTWPVTLTTACANVGCKAIAGIQCYPSEGASDPDPNGLTIYNETSGIRKAMESNSKILGYAFFRGSYLSIAGAKVVDSTTIDMTVTPGDDAGNATKYVFTLQNGLTCSAVSNKTGWASGASFAISSDKKTITITNGGSTILSEGSTASFRMTVSGTVSETAGIAMLRAYTGSGYSEGYGYCGSILQSHTHSYTAKVTTAASCSATGVKTYTCSCGNSYTEVIEKTAHEYTASTNASTGLTTYTCSVCKYSYTSTCGATHSCVETWARENNTHYTVCYDCKAKATEQCVFEIQSIVNPTATTAGSVVYVCVGSNSLSYQISHDAFSGKGCGRTYSVTLPAGSGYTYVNNFNGTHTRTNTATEVPVSNLAHVYTNGVCACGEVERSFINLQFKEYSVANKLGYWTLNQLRGDIDNAKGVVSGEAYGKDPYLQLPANGDVVNYTIRTGDIVEVRIKATVLSGSADKMQFFYTTTAEKKYTEAKSVTVDYTPTATYQIVRFNLTKNIGETVNALRLDPFSNCSADFRAQFELDYIYVGAPDQAPSAYPDGVFMDFTNDNASAGRYLADDTYSGIHYDLGCWYVNAGRSAKPVIDHAAGTMILNIAATTDDYGSTGHSPYVQTSDAGRINNAVPLHYVPTAEDVVQLRVKFVDCVKIPDSNARVRFYFTKDVTEDYGTVDGSNYITMNFKDADLSDGRWHTYTMAATEIFASAKIINAVRPSFNNIRSADGKTGQVIIDYIYVGPKANVPEQTSLYFDFTNTTADAQRYSNKTYGYVNFDRSSPKVNYYSGSTVAVNNADGTLSVTAKATLAADAYPCIYFDTNKDGSYHTYPLDYNPKNAEVLQVRFKMEDFVVGTQLKTDGTEKTVNPYLLMSYFVDQVNSTTAACDGALFDAEVLTSGEYVVVTAPLYDSFRSQADIDKIRIFFGGVESPSDTRLGKVTIDYVYVGPKADCPVQDQLYFNFSNTEADQARYNSKTYGYVNFDSNSSKLNWYSGSTLAIDHTEAVMTVTAPATMADDAYPCVYFDSVKGGNYHTYPLLFNPENAEVYQIRFRLENFRVGTQVATDGTEKTVAPYVLLSYFIDNTNKTYAAVTGEKISVESLTSGAYQTVTVKLNDTFRNERNIDKLRIFFGGMESISESKLGKVIIDYIYVGPEKGAPKAVYTVNFVGADGKTLESHLVAKGETAVYLGATPTKAADATNHYTFKGWDKALTNITADTTLAAQFTAIAHSYTNAKVDGTNHKGTCSCGYTVTSAHGWDSGKVTTAATCTATGVKTYTCTTCKATKTETIAKTGHAYTRKSNGNGTHTATCSRCNNSYTEAHTFTNGTCVCGDKERTLDESIKILHTLDLASDISVTFAVQKTALASYDSYYLECVIPKYENNALVGSTTVEIQPVVSGNYYYFTLTGITAVQMNDMVEAVLHMTKGTQAYYSKTDSYSVATYAYGMLNSSKDAKMLTLCADLLRYGAEAQSFKKYRTDALADANMTATHRSYLSNTDALTFTATDSYLGDLASPTVTWVGKTLDLGTKVGLKFVFNAKNYSGDIAKLSMKVTYQGANGTVNTVTLTGAEVYNAANKQYSFTFYGLLASELRTIVDVAIYNGNTQLSETLRYSAESYAAKTGTTALAGLTKALFAYSDSAKSFFAK